MTDSPWHGDATSLVDAFRAGERSPKEELQATLAAIEASRLNAFSHLDPERALAAAERADVNLPFGGVPVGIKELDAVIGWPDTDASLVFKDRIATENSPIVERLLDDGGAVPVGLTTSSEFGGLNVSVTKLNGVTHNPWEHGRTVGGSSAGSSSAVAGGLVTLATGSDGGGSIRIPAGYTGLFGMKGTFGRIARGPLAFSRPNTAVPGCLARSVRDGARFFDVCAGPHLIDPLSITSPGGWEAGLGTHELAGLKVAVVPGLGSVTLEDGVAERITEHAAALIEATGMKQVDIDLKIVNITAEWMMGNVSTLLAVLGDRWPACAGDLTQSIEDGLRLSSAFYNLRTSAVAEAKRLQLNEAMAELFGEVDLVICATNPGPAFPAHAEMSSPMHPTVEKVLASSPGRLGARAALGAVRMAGAVSPNLPSKVLHTVTQKVPDMLEMGGLTIVSNIYGNPAVSIPAGVVRGLPVGMQVLARHHADALLFDVGLAAERELPWPLVAS
ncbi:MAG: amidase [Acidimicrobiales bacterium]